MGTVNPPPGCPRGIAANNSIVDFSIARCHPAPTRVILAAQVTKDELIDFGTKRYGTYWLRLLSRELGCDNSALWRMSKGELRISQGMANRLAALPVTPPVQLSPAGNPWKKVPSLNGEFEASSDGCIRRAKFKGEPYIGLIIKPRIGKHGYQQVAITVGGKRRWLTVHKIIAETFIGPRPPGMHIDHVDGNKTNNAASNLEYVTPEENIRRAYKLGLIRPPAPGRRHRKLLAALPHILIDPESSLSEESKRIGWEAVNSRLFSTN